MTQKIVFYYGPKSGFRRHLPKRLPITTISELAIYSDRKMREHTFKIQSARRGAENPEKEAERLQVPCLVAFSEQYASISESAINSFLSFIGQFDVGSIYLQNPPMHVVSQFESLHSRVKTIRYDYRTLDFDCLRRINREYDGVIIGQPEVKEKLLKALYPLASGSSEKPAVLLFYGPTGVGKSETAKYLSDVMGQTLLRRQFSMFHSNEFSSYLFGGRHTGNCLAKDLMERESNVILFDEFDKPNPVFHSAFYQVFDEGIYEDRNYRADARRAPVRRAEQQAFALVGVDDAHRHAHHRRLARAVGPYEAEDFAAPYLELHAVERARRAEALRHVVVGEDDLRRRHNIVTSAGIPGFMTPSVSFIETLIQKTMFARSLCVSDMRGLYSACWLISVTVASKARFGNGSTKTLHFAPSLTSDSCVEGI